MKNSEGEKVFDEDEIIPFPQFEVNSVHQLHSLVDIASGSFAGLAICISGHPFDTIKVRLQMETGNRLIKCVREMASQQGIFSFYKGLSSPLMTVPLVNAVVFGSYEFYYRLFNPTTISQTQQFDFQDGLFAGCFAGFVNSFVVCPIELTQCRLQMQKETNYYKGPLDCFTKIIREQGFRGIFRGMFSTIMRQVPGYAGQFSAYQLTKIQIQKYKKKDNLTNFQNLIAGGIGGWACWITSYPQDLIKTHIQCDNSINGQRQFQFNKYIPDGGFINCWKEVVKNQGQRGLWRGFGASMIRAFYANGLGFLAYEQAKHFLTQNYLNTQN